ncbi:MAG: hypothetical protein HKO13_09335 [Sphingomonas sp.]|nr:hypothetical protein [Sphingomonas sp.]RZV49650.1 MAG: hypothetical protein EX258_06900 [Sphingomonadaceae bacterium]
MDHRITLAAAAAAIIIAPCPAAAGPQDEHMRAAPSGDETTRYCMKIEPVTGTRVERIKCWTRAEWKDQGVDVDAEWAAEGVRVIK